MLKTVSSYINAIGALVYKGTWNASTNTPTLQSGVGNKGDYYYVSVAGTTNLDGITDWQIGDLAVFNGSVWQKIDNTDAVLSVNGQTGVVVLGATDVGATPNTAYVLAGTGISGGGQLTGNVTINLANTAVVTGTYGSTSNIPQITVDQQGRITSLSNVAVVTGGTVSNVATGTGLTGGPITTTGTISLANTAVTAGSYGGSGEVGSFTVDQQGRITTAANVTIVATSVNLSNTSANATFATASLPLDPEGYVTVLINGAFKKIPYYGV